jgi:Glycosyl transferase family 2
MDATVIVNAYQQADTIDVVLYALRQQDYDGTWEVVVVDDGSTDRCSDIVASHADQALIPITYVRQPHHGNRWSRARNLGIQLSRGACLLMLDGDMVPDTDVLRLHVTEQNKTPSLLAGQRLWRHHDIDLADADTAVAKLERLRTAPESRDPNCRRRQAQEERFRAELLASPLPWRAWFGCHASMPKQPGATYDEDMPGWGLVDVELACRLHHRTGIPVRFLDQARAWQVERDQALANPFRTGDPVATTQLVRQVCRMINLYPDLPLAEAIAMDFDRLVLDSDGRWHTVPRGSGGNPADVLQLALKWYSEHREGVPAARGTRRKASSEPPAASPLISVAKARRV